MSWWWVLVPLWSLSGVLGWAWYYYALTKTYGDGLELFWKICGTCCGLFGGPLAVITTLIAIWGFPPENRWGLRFW